MRTLLQHWLTAVFVIALFGIGLVADWVSHKRSRAELLLRSMAELKLGGSAFTEARELAEQYGGKPESGGSERGGCSAQACTFTFVIDNKPLNYIPGGRGVRFVAAIAVKDGYVMEQQIDYTILNSTAIDFTYLLVDHFDPQSFAVRKLNVDADGIPHVLEVTLGRSATAQQRQRAYAIELSCLARLRGCNHAAAVFPSGL